MKRSEGSISAFSYLADFPDTRVRPSLPLTLALIRLNRVLITLIEDNDHRRGSSCKIHRADTNELGMVVQTNQIGVLKRMDDAQHRVLEEQSRGLVQVFYEGISPNSKKVAALLKRTTLVPTIVCIFLLAFLVSAPITEPSRPECIQHSPPPLGFRFRDMILPNTEHEHLLGTWKALPLIVMRLVHELNPAGTAAFNAWWARRNLRLYFFGFCSLSTI